ncbi:hypothetical protein [Arthrobacter sp. B0490]|uniref:hypothetical protein n=1 Tax=Arthrobacter sp. B0490 TaxID=2058891 RepID=UPI000CE54EFF|nr:hypothetical protein [Arthrobacter sp. B0490]
MCGACGRTVVADPVLGSVRTTRDLLLVAQTVNAITSGLPGRPVVRVAGDGWVLPGRTGTTTSCDTVEQVWSALVSIHASGASRLAEALTSSLPASSALADRVLREGIAVVEPFRSGVMAT